MLTEIAIKVYDLHDPWTMFLLPQQKRQRQVPTAVVYEDGLVWAFQAFEYGEKPGKKPTQAFFFIVDGNYNRNIRLAQQKNSPL